MSAKALMLAMIVLHVVAPVTTGTLSIVTDWAQSTWSCSVQSHTSMMQQDCEHESLALTVPEMIALTLLTLNNMRRTTIKASAMPVAANLKYWIGIGEKERKYRSVMVLEIVLEKKEGGREAFMLEGWERGLEAEQVMKVKLARNIKYSPAKGTTEVIFDSWIGLTIFPGRWMQRCVEKLNLRPSETRIKAVDGGGVGLAGRMPMKVRPPSTRG
jgi:hypothetical protein